MPLELDPNTNQWVETGVTEPQFDPEAQGGLNYRLPEGAEVSERDAQGNPIRFEYKGETYYPPGSQAYKQGFRTETERLQDGGGRQVGLHQGESVPEGTVFITDDKGKPIKRLTRDELERGYGYDFSVQEKLGLTRYPVKNEVGREVLLKREQFDKLTDAKTDDDRLKAAKELKLVPDNWTLEDFTGETERKRAAKESAEAFVSQQEAARFERLNTKLPDGQWINKTDLAALKKQDPDGYKIITAQGFGAYEKYIAKAQVEYMSSLKAIENQESALKTLEPYKVGKDTYDLQAFFREKTLSDRAKYVLLKAAGFDLGDKSVVQAKLLADQKVTPKTIFQALTPWDEAAGQTYLEYMKGFPQRFTANFVLDKKQPSQEELRAEYKAFHSSPLWLQLLGSSNIIYDAKTGQYQRIVMGEAPLTSQSKSAQIITQVGGIGKGAAQQMAKTGTKNVVRVLDDVSLGMSREQFLRYRDALRINPELSPDTFKQIDKLKPNVKWDKVTESAEKAKQQKSDWTKIEKSIKEGKRLVDDDKQQEVFNQYLKELKELIAAGEEMTAAPKPLLKPSPTTPREGGTAWAYYRWQTANQPSVKAPVSERLTRLQQGKVTASQPPSQLSANDVKVRQVSAAVIVTSLENATGTTVVSPEQIDRKSLAIEIEKQLKAIPDTKLRSAVRAEAMPVIRTLTETRTKPATKTLVKPAELTQVQTRARTQMQAQTQTKTQVRTQVRPVTMMQTGLKIQVKPSVKPSIGVRLQAKVPVRQPIEPPEKRRPPKLKDLPGKSDREARLAILNAKGAIGWRQGKIGGKDRYDVIINPYQKDEDYVMVLGPPPRGASIATGATSAYRTAKVLYGKAPARDFSVDSGFQDVKVDAEGKKVTLTFTPDPKGLTRDELERGYGYDFSVQEKLITFHP